MANLGDLSTFISEKLKDDSNTAVPATRVKRAVNDAVIYWKKRGRHLWFNEFEENVTLTVDNPAFSLSTNTALAVFDRGGMVITYNQIRYELTKVSTEVFDHHNIQAPGLPYIWTYRNDGFECYFYPDQAYTLTVRGYKDYSALATDGTDDSQTNDWMTDGETLIEHEALARLHVEYRQDEKMGALYAQSARDEFLALNKLHKEKYGTGRNYTSSYLL